MESEKTSNVSFVIPGTPVGKGRISGITIRPVGLPLAGQGELFQ